jgi:hypothetical protein
MVSHYQLLYIRLTLVYEEIDDTLQIISIEAEWQMVGHYQLLYISLTLVYEEVDDTHIITDNDLPSVVLPLY